ncbi:MAG: citrate synthase [Candidatus Heimdallarchaeota archaeon]|nr:citrate synthase [Candidatus Heimdallarchaeota archaeon]
MSEKMAKINIDDKEFELPYFVGTEGETAINIIKMRGMSGVITYDNGYGNTGSCKSAVTFIDGEKGILRYRGYQIEDLAEMTCFEESVYLILYGELPNKDQLADFKAKIVKHHNLDDGIYKILDLMPLDAHPMGVLSSLSSALAGFYPTSDSLEDRDEAAIMMIAKMKTLSAAVYRRKLGKPYIKPRDDLGYVADFLQMMYRETPDAAYEVNKTVEKALDKLLILHIDHEQNCSASTVRMCGSSQANIFTVIGAGIAALWGPLHGGANQKVLDMLALIQREGGDTDATMAKAKDKNSGFRLMGFGHRVYKNFDPRAQILKKSADEILGELNIQDPLLDIAKGLEKIALEDNYFVDRKLYPNVDYYSGIIYSALGIPVDFMTVMFTLGRTPGWLAQWRESREDPDFRIHRPRQVYIGETKRPFKPMAER